jgi:ubiquinone/menaquinone biosynthesis C-methylase UbiE
LEGLPSTAAQASLGFGNPTPLIELRQGEVVLDLGCGGGIDVLLAARRVRSNGFVYGIDLSDAMLELARRNAAEAHVRNVTFLKADIAAIPLPDHSVDVIISNAVINLVANKQPVFREAFRVLKPGGRFAALDIVILGGLPAELPDSPELRRELSARMGCILGAPTDEEYRSGLMEVGFTKIGLEITRRYRLADLGLPPPGWVMRLGDQLAARVMRRFTSSLVRATKPAQAASRYADGSRDVSSPTFC